MDEKKISEMKVSELLDELNNPEPKLVDEKDEDERVSEIYKEIEESIPFSKFVEDIEALSDRLDKLEKVTDRLEYFVRGLQIADVIQKLDRRNK